MTNLAAALLSDSDIIWGADEIGKVLGLDTSNKTGRRRALYLLENKDTNGIPVKKVGARLHMASRAALLEWAKDHAE